MVTGYRIENIWMFFHHFPVTVLRAFKQEPFRIDHHLMESRFGNNSSKPFPLVRLPIISILTWVKVIVVKLPFFILF
jgi:hypothetical protein